MKTKVEFKTDDRELSAASATDDEGLFWHTLIVVPVRMRIGGRDVLDDRPPPRAPVWIVDQQGSVSSPGIFASDPSEETGWIRQPIIGFIARLADALREVTETGSARQMMAMGWGDMMYALSVDGTSLSVTGPTGIQATLPIGDLEAALDRFREDVRKWIVSTVPGLEVHPMWRRWFSSDGAA